MKLGCICGCFNRAHRHPTSARLPAAGPRLLGPTEPSRGSQEEGQASRTSAGSIGDGSGFQDGAAFETQVTASMKEAFKEELVHFADCVGRGLTPETPPAEAQGDVALLHRIFHALKRPLAG